MIDREEVKRIILGSTTIHEQKVEDWIFGGKIGRKPILSDCLADELCAKAIPRWIPTTESTPHFSPNKWRKVFVTLEDLDGKRFTTTAKYDEDHHYWYDFTTSRYNDFKVVAWMVKPEPYAVE